MAGLALTLLAVGVLTWPPTPTAPVIQTPDEHTAPLLEAELKRRDELAAFDGIREAGSRVIGYSVSVQPPDRPRRRTLGDPAPTGPGGGAVGVIVGPGRIVTHISGLGDRQTVRVTPPSGVEVDASVAAIDAASGLALLVSGEAGDWPAAPITAQPVAPGSVLTAAGRTPSGEVIAPVFIGSATTLGYDTAGTGALPRGTPLYTPDGNLVAMLGDGPSVFSLAPALARIERDIAAGTPIPASLALSLQDNAAEMEPWFGTGGAVVADLADDGPAAAAGLTPGDVLLTIDDEAVTSASEAVGRIARAKPDMPLRIAVRRGRTTRQIEASPGAAYRVPATGRTSTAGEGSRLDERLQPEQLARLDVPGRARLLAVDGGPVPARGAIVRGRGAHLLYVDDGRERYFAVLAPEGERR